MRLIKAVIFGSIVGLLAYYVIKLRDSTSHRRAAESARHSQNDISKPFDFADGLEDSGHFQPTEIETDDSEKSLTSDIPVQSADALILSSTPYTPYLFGEAEKKQQSTETDEEDVESADIYPEEYSDDHSPSATLFDIEMDVEPPQHPGHRIRTGAHHAPNAQRLPRAKIRCRDEGGEWSLYLDLPDEREVEAIQHDAQQVVFDREVEIQRFTGRVTISYEDGGRDVLDLFDTAPLYFRSNSEWEQDGTLVLSHSSGFFIVIAPTDRDDEFIDIEELEPEDCADADFHAHFLAVGADDPPDYRGQYPMALEGTTLHDVADRGHHGDLYVGRLPELSVPEEVYRARVVEETGRMGENRWGRNFDPHSRTIASVLDGRQGRFTVRTYLKGSRARNESRPFRYSSDVRRITLDGNTYTPDMIMTPDSENRFGDALLRFEGRQSLIQPVNVDNLLVSVSEDGLIKIPPDPTIGNVTCELPSGVSIAVEVPRIWWRLCAGDDRLAWNDIRPIIRDDFIRIAREGAYIEILLPRSVTTILVGIGGFLDHRISSVQNRATVDLRDFVDHEVLENQSPGTSTQMSFSINDSSLALMEIGVPRARVTAKSRRRTTSRRQPTWLDIHSVAHKEICRRDGHHWVFYTHAPSQPIKAVNDEGRECRRCGATQIRTE